MLGPNKRCARHLAPKASHRDPCDDQFVSGPRCGREERRIEPGERALGPVEASCQEKTPNLEVARMRRVQTVAVSFERRPRRVQYFRRRAQVARHERDLGLGDDTPRTGDRLSRTEGACRTSQKGLRAREITELRHRDTAKRKPDYTRRSRPQSTPTIVAMIIGWVSPRPLIKVQPFLGQPVLLRHTGQGEPKG
jgi:hypothetical protein